MDLEVLDHTAESRKLLKVIRDFDQYITNNHSFIPNYDDRFRHGEPISSSIAESTINQVVGKRFVMKQQMRWTKRSAHFPLKVRTKTLNDELRSTSARWYPEMQQTT